MDAIAFEGVLEEEPVAAFNEPEDKDDDTKAFEALDKVGLRGGREGIIHGPSENEFVGGSRQQNRRG